MKTNGGLGGIEAIAFYLNLPDLYGKTSAFAMFSFNYDVTMLLKGFGKDARRTGIMSGFGRFVSDKILIPRRFAITPSTSVPTPSQI